MRIAFCGYEGEHEEFPPTWEKVAWKTQGGYASLGEGRGKENRALERVWFSPHCLKPENQTDAQGDFFAASCDDS